MNELSNNITTTAIVSPIQQKQSDVISSLGILKARVESLFPKLAPVRNSLAEASQRAVGLPISPAASPMWIWLDDLQTEIHFISAQIIDLEQSIEL